MKTQKFGWGQGRAPFKTRWKDSIALLVRCLWPKTQNDSLPSHFIHWLLKYLKRSLQMSPIPLDSANSIISWNPSSMESTGAYASAISISAIKRYNSLFLNSTIIPVVWMWWWMAYKYKKFSKCNLKIYIENIPSKNENGIQSAWH